MRLFTAFGELVIRGEEAANRALDRLDHYAKRAAKGLKTVSDTADKLGKSLSSKITAPILAATTAMGALITKTTNYAKEVTRFAQVGNTTTTEFQRMAAAASTVGIENEKLADILKDVNDKIGDYMVTGGGAMVDFFENIAPKVGLTKEAFRGLSGPQALGLYVAALERAGVSQAEMTFYMEAIASDATALLPILRNNGAEWNRLATEASAAGKIMSEENIKASEDFRKNLKDLTDTISGLVTQLGIELIPTANLLVEMFREHALPVIRDFIKWVGELAAWFESLDKATQEWIVKMALLAAAIGPVLVILAPFIAALGTLISVVGSAIAFVGGFAVALGPVMAIVLRFIPIIGALWAAWEVGKLIWPMLKATFDLIVQGAGWLVSSLGDAFSAIPGLLGSVVDWFGGMYDGVIGWVKQLPGAVWDYISSMASGVINRVRNMVQGVIDSLKGMYQAVVGNSIIPDMARDVGREITSMADDGISETRRMSRGMEKAMPLDTYSHSGDLTAGNGSGDRRGGVVYDLRNSIFRDDRDMLARMRLQGVEPTGAY